MDISSTALLKCQARLGTGADPVRWIVGDVTAVELPSRTYDVWHDRAVFHFLTGPCQRRAYVRQAASALKPGGSVIVATFGPDGPQSCSGLPATRYDEQSLQSEVGPEFRLLKSSVVDHRTPSGGTQKFLYCHFRFEPQKG